MKRRVVFFFPHNPCPPRSGAHKYCLELIAGLKEVGCEITFASSMISSETIWNNESVKRLQEDLVKEVRIYKTTLLDALLTKLIGRYYSLIKQPPAVNSAMHTPPGMRRWFTTLLEEISPDIVMINYAFWDGLLDHERFKSIVRTINVYDLITLNVKMQQVLRKYLSNLPINADQIDERIIEESFFENGDFKVNSDELYIFDKYNHSIAISSVEMDIIKKNTQKTEIVLIPVTHEVRYITNSYTGPALFPTGPNLFNIQAYLYFVRRVLARVRQQAPSFILQVTGSCCANVLPAEGVMLSGFVSDLEMVYESASFVVCPTLGGTGQQIKIVEAMAHGIPVIATRYAAKASPIHHGVNGLVANSAEEFADQVIELWNDRELCRKLGGAARDTIAAEFSRSRFLDQLSTAIGVR